MADEGEADDGSGLRWYVVAAYVLVIVAGFAVATWGLIGWWSGCENRGLSGAAGDSTRVQLCRSAGGAVALVVPAGWVLGLVLATLALVRWEGGVRATVLLVVAFLAPVVLPAAAYAGFERSSTSCSEEDLAAYRAWVDEGSSGQPPSDCRTF